MAVSQEVFFYAKNEDLNDLETFLISVGVRYSEMVSSHGGAKEFVSAMPESMFKELANRINTLGLPFIITTTRKTDIVSSAQAEGLLFLSSFDITYLKNPFGFSSTPLFSLTTSATVTDVKSELDILETAFDPDKKLIQSKLGTAKNVRIVSFNNGTAYIYNSDSVLCVKCIFSTNGSVYFNSDGLVSVSDSSITISNINVEAIKKIFIDGIMTLTSAGTNVFRADVEYGLKIYNTLTLATQDVVYYQFVVNSPFSINNAVQSTTGSFNVTNTILSNYDLNRDTSNIIFVSVKR